MQRDDIITLLGDNWTEVRKVIRQYIRSDVGLLDRTNEAILENSGKMLRPMVTLLTAGAVSAIGKDSILLAVFSELLHNATLIHDDVTDHSRTRRGRPTVMSLLGPSAAVLVGDFWLAKAMEVLTETGCRAKVEKLFTRTISDLAEGEMLQLEKSISLDTDEDDYFRVIYFKTASLFQSSCTAGAVSAGAGCGIADAASEYGRALGIAFQIRDDILDYEGNEAMGKPLGADIREKKITLPLLGAFRNAPDSREAIVELLSAVEGHPENCDSIRRFVLENGGVAHAVSLLEEYVDRAVAALALFPASPFRDALEAIARFNLDRIK